MDLLQTVSSFVFPVFCFLIGITSFFKSVKVQNLNKSLEESIMYNKTLQNLNDSLRCFRHDFSNIMQSIDGYITNEDMSGLKEYYSEIRNELNLSNNLSLLNPNLINEPALYSLITSKYNLAENLGIKFEVNISATFNDIRISPYVFSRIIGILLDNAIEASKSSNEKEIFLDVSKTFVSNYTRRTTISIRNTYSDKNIDIDRIREKGYTSKNSDTVTHGLGLWEVDKLLKKSNNLNLYTTKNAKFFEQNLEIFDINKKKSA